MSGEIENLFGGRRRIVTQITDDVASIEQELAENHFSLLKTIECGDADAGMLVSTMLYVHPETGTFVTVMKSIDGLADVMMQSVART